MLVSFLKHFFVLSNAIVTIYHETKNISRRIREMQGYYYIINIRLTVRLYYQIAYQQNHLLSRNHGSKIFTKDCVRGLPRLARRTRLSATGIPQLNSALRRSIAMEGEQTANGRSAQLLSRPLSIANINPEIVPPATFARHICFMNLGQIFYSEHAIPSQSLFQEV